MQYKSYPVNGPSNNRARLFLWFQHKCGRGGCSEIGQKSRRLQQVTVIADGCRLWQTSTLKSTSWGTSWGFDQRTLGARLECRRKSLSLLSDLPWQTGRVWLTTRHFKRLRVILRSFLEQLTSQSPSTKFTTSHSTPKKRSRQRWRLHRQSCRLWFWRRGGHTMISVQSYVRWILVSLTFYTKILVTHQALL